MDKKWEYNCPQFVDFTQMQDLNVEDDAFFENCTLESNISDKDLKKKRSPVFTFSASYLSTMSASTQTSGCAKQKVKAMAEAQVKAATSTTNIKEETVRCVPKTQAKAAVPANPRQYAVSVKSRKMIPAHGMSKKSPQMPTVKRKLRNTPAKASRVTQAKSQVATKGRKRSASFVHPRAAKKKVTCPTTPECLRRSIQKAGKSVKSSEDIELERIAELRKQIREHLKTNEVAVKRIIRASSMKPIDGSVQIRGTAKSIASQQPMDKKLGSVMKSNRRTGKLGASNPQEPKKLGKIETVFQKPSGLIRSSTPYSLRKKPSSRAITQKFPPLESIVKSKPMPLKSSKPLIGHKAPHSGLPFIQKQQNNSMSVSQISAIKEDTLNMSTKNEGVKLDSSQMSIDVKEFKEVSCPDVSQSASAAQSKQTPLLRKVIAQGKKSNSSIERRAQLRAAAWRKKVEEEMKQQSKSLFKVPSSQLTKNSRPYKKPLSDITGLCQNKQAKPQGCVKKASSVEVVAVVKKGEKVKTKPSQKGVKSPVVQKTTLAVRAQCGKVNKASARLFKQNSSVAIKGK